MTSEHEPGSPGPHSPLPWVVKWDRVLAADQSVVGVGFRAYADAQYLVRCVNAYPELLSIVQGVAELSKLFSDYDKEAPLIQRSRDLVSALLLAHGQEANEVTR